MDKELLKKYNLEEAVKRFNQINEYTFITSPMLSEDGEDEEMGNNNQNQDQNQPMNGQNDPNQQSQEQMPMDNAQNDDMNQPPMGDEQPQDMNNQPMSDDSNSSMPEDGGEEPMQDTPMGDDMNNDVETEQEGDEVIDIDDLTQSQEASEIKIDGVDEKLTKMLDVLNKFSSALEANDKKITDLKKEFEERNPSQQEKFNLRSQASFPYSETPKNYWDKKTSENPHYNVMYDNDVSTADEQKKFEITKDDVDNINYSDISKSFDLEDFFNF